MEKEKSHQCSAHERQRESWREKEKKLNLYVEDLIMEADKARADKIQIATEKVSFDRNLSEPFVLVRICHALHHICCCCCCFCGCKEFHLLFPPAISGVCKTWFSTNPTFPPPQHTQIYGFLTFDYPIYNRNPLILKKENLYCGSDPVFTK